MTVYSAIHVNRTPPIQEPDQSRVLLRPFSPGGPERVDGIISRIMSLPEDQVGPLMDQVSAEFSQRHQNIRAVFLERFSQVREFRLTGENHRPAQLRNPWLPPSHRPDELFSRARCPYRIRNQFLGVPVFLVRDRQPEYNSSN
jgi:hypothetical protein